MLWNFSVLFPKAKSNAQHEEELQQLRRGIAQHFSRGNVRLQQGKFITAIEAEELKRQSLQLKF